MQPKDTLNGDFSLLPINSSMQNHARKPRYPVHWPLQFRRVEDPEWRLGRTLNMSLTGVLFESAEPLEEHEQIELSIMFQAPGGPASAQIVNAHGQVVRHEPRVPARIAVKFAS